ncbi:DUF2752 domain-containing protein, partial [Demequina sp. TTPB684]|uniref:DUF2752 domain-containing protein n=1 Tax=Demequina sp. TTPB684 TaxID=2881057 RepID=UPI001CF5AB65
ARATRTSPPKGQLAWPALVALVAAGGTAYIVTHNPHVSGGTFVCPLFATTGLYCPGCGGTRAVYDLAHGNVAGALAMNPLFTLAVPLLGVLWVRWVMRLRGFVLREWPFPTWAGIALPAVILAFLVLRNVGPFASLLSP